MPPDLPETRERRAANRGRGAGNAAILRRFVATAFVHNSVHRVMTASTALNIEDLRRLARRRVPALVFDYIDGGADAEITLRENCRIFDDVTFRPRNAV